MVRSHKQHLILIADRNPRVRGYLKREMQQAGYEVKLAAACREVIEALTVYPKIAGIIIDPDLPGAETDALRKMVTSDPHRIPIIIHSLLEQSKPDFFFCPEEIIVEKGGASAEQLKQVLYRLFGRSRPSERLSANHPV